MLETGDTPFRFQLIDALADAPGERASAALARLAIFDIDPDVRGASIAALAKRPAKEYQATLIRGFRYPWPAVADNAADAVRLLNQQDLVLRLVDMLDLPDPTAPYLNAEKRWVKQEMVRVNHLRNCLLCHPRSTAVKQDPLRGLVPTPGTRLSEEYYESQVGIFVRADVTYLRQDFSAQLPVVDHGAWPAQQRFDFLVQTRELTAAETRGLRGADQPESTSYPQRESVLTALRGLTGADAGSSAEDWRRLQWRKELRGKYGSGDTRKGLRTARRHRGAPAR
jgi:hypothetical protein